MSKVKWFLVAACVAAVVIVITFLVVSSQRQQRTEKSNLQGINAQWMQTVNDFHAKVMRLPEAKGKADAKVALESISGDYSSLCDRALNDDKSKTFMVSGTSVESRLLRNVIDSAITYVNSVKTNCGPKPDGALATYRHSMLVNMKQCNLSLGDPSVVPINEGDMATATNRIRPLVRLATKPDPPPPPKIVYVNAPAPDWTNSSYGGYHEGILDVFSKYDRIRGDLATILALYDNSNHLRLDRFALQQAIDKRRSLLVELRGMTIPPEPVFLQQHQALTVMLGDAIPAMEQFYQAPSVATRQAISLVSDRNSAQMLNLRRFYGVYGVGR